MNFLSRALLYVFATILPICSLKADSKDEYKILASLKIQPTAMWEGKVRSSLKTIFGNGGPKLLDHFFDAMARHWIALRSDTNAGIYVIERSKNTNHDGDTASETLLIALTKADGGKSRTYGCYRGWQVFGDTVSDECFNTLIDDVSSDIDDIIAAKLSPKMVEMLPDKSVAEFIKLSEDDPMFSFIVKLIGMEVTGFRSLHFPILDDIAPDDRNAVKTTVSLRDGKLTFDTSCTVKEDSDTYNWLCEIASDKNRPRIVFDIDDDTFIACNGVVKTNGKDSGVWIMHKNNGNRAIIREVNSSEKNSILASYKDYSEEAQYSGFKIFSKECNKEGTSTSQNDDTQQMRYVAINRDGAVIRYVGNYSIDDVHSIIDRYTLPQRTEDDTQNGALYSDYFNMINYICRDNREIKALPGEKCAIKHTGYFSENGLKIRNEISIDDIKSLMSFCRRNANKIPKDCGIDCDQVFQIIGADESGARDKE